MNLDRYHEQHAGIQAQLQDLHHRQALERRLRTEDQDFYPMLEKLA